MEGKIPPHATELEEAIIGAILMDKDALSEVSFLGSGDFYKEAHRLIFESIKEMDDRGDVIDILTLVENLKSKNRIDEVGGVSFVAQLTNRVASSSNIEYHGRIVAQKAMQRELAALSFDLGKKAYDNGIDVFELSDWAERKMFEVVETRTRGKGKTIQECIKELSEKANIVANKKEGLSGLPSGFFEVDRISNGFQPSELIILAARPGMGKTSLALQIGINASKQGLKGLVFSLEMSRIQLTARLVACEAGISANKILKTGMGEEEFTQFYSKTPELINLPMQIDDTAGMTVKNIKSIARVEHKKNGLDYIIIDYLQLIEATEGGNRNEQVGYISRQLKLIAKELNIPVICLSQLSRAVESRGGSKKPQLSDLRESGSIEQDADSVLFLYRPGYYGIEMDASGNPIGDDVAELEFAKHRSGAIDTARLRWVGWLTKFENYSDIPRVSDGLDYVSGEF